MNENEQIADIIRLNDGYVLRIYGQTVACRDEKELGAQVSRRAKRGRKLGLESKSAPVPIRPEVAVMEVHTPDQREQFQEANLYRLIQSRLDGQMTEEELMDATLLACPDLDRERVVATIQLYTERYFGMAPPDPNQESPLGPKCACPDCKMNQSVPNHLEMCVSCFAGEHLHPPAGQEWPQEAPKVVETAWWSQEDEDDANDADDAEPAVPGVEEGPGEPAPADHPEPKADPVAGGPHRER